MTKELHIHFLCPFCGAIHYLKRELIERKNRRQWHFDLFAKCLGNKTINSTNHLKAPISIDIIKW